MDFFDFVDVDVVQGVDTFVFMAMAIVATIILVVTFLLGEVFDIAGDFGLDVDDVGGGLLNLQSVAAFIAGFGSVAWLLSAYFDVPALGAAVGGLAGGLPVGGLVAVMTRYLIRQEATTSHALSDLVGSSAIVTLAIPGAGVGRIQYERGGSTHTITARSSSGDAIAQGSVVAIQSVVAGECLVAPV